MKPILVVLTNQFPGVASKSEDWLYDEINFTCSYYDKIFIIPSFASKEYGRLPENCEIRELEKAPSISLSFFEKINCLKIVNSDFTFYPEKTNFFKAFRYNLSLIKNLHLRAKKISILIGNLKVVPIVYAYWADNLATTACILKQRYTPCKLVTRGHGFEIFEEQTKYNVIPFRNFQYQFLTRLYADSKRGMEHLNKKFNNYKSSNSFSYVGTKDLGISVFDPEATFTIISCSIIRNVKRLHLMSDILRTINFKIVWHVLGDGPDLSLVKEKNEDLPKNVTVNYHGFLGNAEILNFYKSHHINLFVSLSYSEGLPVSMMEAQSFGIPILCTDVGGCKEICNSETGILIDKNFDPKEVAEKITEFKNSKKNTIPFREKCRKYWLENFNGEVNYTNFAKEISAL